MSNTTYHIRTIANYSYCRTMNVNNNKRAHHHHLQPSSNNDNDQLRSSSNSHKRRKKNNNNKRKHSHWSGGAHTNWIENCSDTANRVLPKDCAAPLLCLITRAEIGIIDDDDSNEKVVVDKEDMKPIPLTSTVKGRVGDLADHKDDADVGGRSYNAGDDNYGCITAAETATKADCSSAIDIDDAEQVDVGDVEDVAPTAAAEVKVQSSSADIIASVPTSISTSGTSKSIDHTISNIARPSTSFLLQYAREKVPFEVPSIIQGDVDDAEEKRLFIPVKRHASAIGPTKVRFYACMQYECPACTCTVASVTLVLVFNISVCTSLHHTNLLLLA